MNTKRVLLILGVAIMAAALVLAGTAFAQSGWGDRDGDWMHTAPNAWGSGHMSAAGHMPGWNDEDGRFAGMMGGQFGAMMGGWGGLVDVEPLTLEEAESAVADFLAESGEENWAVGEVMIFENHAYAQVVDAASGEGAFEVLVDPQTGNVTPEPGPNMMWNTEYGHMAGGMMHGYQAGMMGGQYGHMMGGFDDTDRDANAAPDVDTVEAVGLAQAYLDEFLPGAAADEHADAFPGYYTLHVLRDGQVVGMLSVNAFSGDVFPHTWHGDFVEMAKSHVE